VLIARRLRPGGGFERIGTGTAARVGGAAASACAPDAAVIWTEPTEGDDRAMRRSSALRRRREDWEGVTKQHVTFALV